MKVFRNRNSLRRPLAPAETDGFGDIIDVEHLETDLHNPFYDEEPQHHRWLITTCVAGAAGSLMIGAAVLGLFGGERMAGKTSPASLASTQSIEIWQRPAVTAKQDFSGIAVSAQATVPKPLQQVALQPQAATEQAITTATLPPLKDPVTPVSRPQVLEGSFHTSQGQYGNFTQIAKTPPPEPVDRLIRLSKGQSLVKQLVKLGVSPSVANSLTQAIEPVFPSSLMQVGQELTITLDEQQDFYGNDVIFPVQVSFSPGPNEQIIVESDEDGRFTARIEGQEQTGRSRYAQQAPHYRAKSKIKSSLYASARDTGVPEYIIGQMMRAFAYDVDFQRQIHPGDTFDLFYGNPLSGSSTKRKVLHYASLSLSGRKRVFFRFTTPDGRTAYYDAKGRSATKALMRTPISGARMSSGFGMRRHPILGYTKMHTGMDFAAPRGTPIKAAGSGKVTYARWRGAYGRTVILDHGKGYKTLYAHMSRIPRGIRPGTRVRQGQVIGYVGSTGRSTGPHLHYEVRRNNRPINPKRLRMANHSQLRGANLAAFKKHKARVLAMMQKAPTSRRYAQISGQ